MARKHDGVCDKHGLWAVETKLPMFQELFISIGVKPNELEIIKAAVINHCESKDIPASSPFYKTSAILKDADALDRIRFNEPVKHLRFKESSELIIFATNLYYQTNTEMEIDMSIVLNVAEKISPVPIGYNRPSNFQKLQNLFEKYSFTF